MRRERLGLFLVGEATRDLARAPQRVVRLREPVDERGAPAEQLRQFVGAQLPR
jgi:hypothetical protein